MYPMKFLFLFLSAILSFEKSHQELYTSFEQMRQLVSTEIIVTSYLESIVQIQSERLEKAKEILRDFKHLSGQAQIDPDAFIGNPVNSFLLIKALSKDVHEFFENLDTAKILNDMKSDINTKFQLPANEDYEGSIVAIHRLEDTYLLNPSEIRTGNISTKYKSRPLTAFECYELGRIAYEREDHFHTVEWMMESLTRLKEEQQNDHVDYESKADLTKILDYLSFSLAKQGNVNWAYIVSKDLLEMDPTNERAKQNHEYYKYHVEKVHGTLENEKIQTEIINQKLASNYDFDKYESLCRATDSLIYGKSNLNCRYINYHPLLKIAPVKEEMIHDNPPIWLYHDIINENQIKVMKSLAFPRLDRASVVIDSKLSKADFRISKSGWLKDHDHYMLPYFTKFVSAITNLTLDTSEDWQIANYGIGGQYEPHHDFFNVKNDTETNRIATWLFYLEAPEAGGGTVFPKIGVAIKPIRGSAVFWYNLHPSGEGDVKTQHAACPVLFGNKWVSNKWIHKEGQEFRRPCNLVKESNEFSE